MLVNGVVRSGELTWWEDKGDGGDGNDDDAVPGYVKQLGIAIATVMIKI